MSHILDPRFDRPPYRMSIMESERGYGLAVIEAGEIIAPPLTWKEEMSRPRQRYTCSLPDCSNPHDARGYCKAHYMRYRRYGDPTLGGTKTGRLPSEQVLYKAAHNRITAARGDAGEHPCDHCGSAAQQWAYDHKDPDELYELRYGVRSVNPTKYTYSTNPDHYIPLCRVCHRKFDESNRKDHE